MRKMDLKKTTLLASMLLSMSFSTVLKANAAHDEYNKLRELNRPHVHAFTVQIGSFHSRENAYRLKARWERLVQYPVNIRYHGGFYHVTVGPVPPTHVARFEYGAKPTPKPTKRLTYQDLSAPAPAKIQTRTKSGAPSWYSDYIPKIHYEGAWFVTADAGVFKPIVKSTIVVDNGSDFDPPNDKDRFSTTTSNPLSIAFTAGRYWERDSAWFPGHYVGLRYQHLFFHEVDGSIMQYSDPTYTNYRDTWSVSSNVLLAETKLELMKAGPIRPYINGGIGVSINQFGSYKEYGEPVITVRTSPAFASRTKGTFAYDVGCGLNFNMNANIVLSIGYDYENIGANDSGPGRTTWSGERIKQGGINGNSVIIGATFLFDHKY